MDKQYNLTELKLGDIIEVNKTRFRVTDLDLEDRAQPLELTLESTDLQVPLPSGLFVVDPYYPKEFAFETLGDSWWVSTELLVRYNIAGGRKTVKSALRIEPGKCYRTRNGKKALVLSHDMVYPSAMYPFKGVIFAADGIFRGCTDSWTKDGRVYSAEDSGEDLVSLYEE